jgi:hypothetical protein
MESLAWDVHKALQIVKDLEYDLDLEENSQEQRKLLKVVREFGIYITANRTFIPNYGDRYRHGETISTAFVESAINQVVSKRMVKKQQMRWTDRGAHLLLQVRTRVLNEEWRSTLSHWYPAMRRHAMRRRPSPRFFPVSFPRSVRFSREWIWRFTDQSCLTSLSANANYPNLTTISQSANRQHLNS